MDTASIMFHSGVERGCGVRRKGGVYLETGMGPGGLPIEHFLYDPPIPTPDTLKLPPRGAKLVTIGGTTHVVKRVGRKHYADLALFVEEARRVGLSQRVSDTLQWSSLNEHSQLLLVHDRAYVKNIAAYGTWQCPTCREDHTPTNQPAMCAGIWWEDVDGVVPIGDGRDGECPHPAGWCFTARRRPQNVDPHHQAAFFGHFPIHRIAVIRGDGHETALAKVQQIHGIAVVELDA